MGHSAPFPITAETAALTSAAEGSQPFKTGGDEGSVQDHGLVSFRRRRQTLLAEPLRRR
jgi:hypothetical protein